VALFGDEGAANHNRLGGEYDHPGIQVFVYGYKALDRGAMPSRYPARQTFESSQAVARLHQLDPDRTVFMQQNPAVIDQGVFHNDVIAVSNQNVLFHHQHAFVPDVQVMDAIRHQMAHLEQQFVTIEVSEAQVSVADAVSSYLFNSQLLTKPNGKMLLIIPQESQENPTVWRYLSELIDSGGVIDEIRVFDLRESMRNGGGPACLRLRVALNDTELQAVNGRVMMTPALFVTLNNWVDQHYRDHLQFNDLADPQLLREGRQALDELTRIFNLGSVYPFQRD
jgi:succinylarginine dihydrolase